jgi:hypothetical protein
MRKAPLRFCSIRDYHLIRYKKTGPRAREKFRRPGFGPENLGRIQGKRSRRDVSLETFLQYKRRAVPSHGPEYLRRRQVPAFYAEDPAGPGEGGVPGNLKVGAF